MCGEGLIFRDQRGERHENQRPCGGIRVFRSWLRKKTRLSDGCADGAGAQGCFSAAVSVRCRPAESVSQKREKKSVLLCEARGSGLPPHYDKKEKRRRAAGVRAQRRAEAAAGKDPARTFSEAAGFRVCDCVYPEKGSGAERPAACGKAVSIEAGHYGFFRQHPLCTGLRCGVP